MIFKSGKLANETSAGYTNGTCEDTYKEVALVDSSKHASFGILINNDSNEGMVGKIQVSNNPEEGEDAVWVDYNDEFVIVANSSEKISGATVSLAMRVLVKNQSEGNDAEYNVFVRLNPMLIV